MKLPTPKTHKKFFAIVAVAVLIVAGGIGAYLWLQRPGVQSQATTATVQEPDHTIDYNPATEEQKAEGDRIKEETINQSQQPQPQPGTAPVVTITRAGQVNNGQTIAVRTIISGTSTGTCTFTFTRNSQTITKTFTITPEPTSVTCNGDIPASEFSAGEWQLSVAAINGSGVQSGAATQTIAVAR